MLTRNVALSNKVKVSNWRKSAAGTWKQSGDCQVYCLQTVMVDNALNYLGKLPYKANLTQLVGQCSGKMIEKHPPINRLLRFGKFYQRKSISIFFQVAMDDQGHDLSGHTVRDINQKSLEQIQTEMQKTIKQIKNGDDVHYKKVKSTMAYVPSLLVAPFIKLYGFILYALNLWSPLFGAPKDAFGSMMITNIGTLGMQTAFVPLVPYSHCPLILSLGAVYERPMAIDGQVVVKKVIDCCWTLDHRVIDGVVGAKMAKTFENYLLNPESLEIK
jgi:pyruvate/2-oxoglutarate dehydrogenase complex dihydrolipoamide acyltransferase (E2) component